MRLPLDQPPEIRIAGLAVHGDPPVEQYHLPDHWCVHLYSYAAQLELDKESIELYPGACSLIPAGTHITYRYPKADCEHCYAIFRPTGDTGPELPTLLDTAHAYTAIRPRFEAIVALHSGQRRRAEALLWTLLWDLHDLSRNEPKASSSRRELVRQARAVLELRMSQAPGIGELAEELEVSHNHLTRAFRKETGKTVLAYFNERRLEKASSLLRHTPLAIKVIAQECGYTDLQHFNKAVRKRFGVSPRALRG